MAKADWLWVAIRIFGLYLLVLALIAFAKVLYSGIAFVSPGGWSDEYQEHFLSNLSNGVVSLIIYGTVGTHLVRGGAWLHRLLMRTGASNTAA